jgi:Utp11 protein
MQHLMGKAAERNPDEFYFAMEKQRTVDGVHQARCEQSLMTLPDVTLPCCHVKVVPVQFF